MSYTTESVKLQNPVTLGDFRVNGFEYIRQVHVPYNTILRSPSVGCYVQLTQMKEAGSLQLDSPKAKKLIRRISYFGY